jgi:hypothetical protein
MFKLLVLVLVATCYGSSCVRNKQAVASVQRILVLLGYKSVKIDGIWGRISRKAYNEVQVKHGFPVTHCVTNLEFNKLVQKLYQARMAAERSEEEKCEGLIKVVQNYRDSGNMRDMADEIRRGELGFITKRFAESCGIDKDMLPVIQKAAGRRAVVGTALGFAFLAGKQRVRALDAIFGVAEDSALTGNDAEARAAAEQAGTMGAAMPVVLDHQDRYQRFVK